MERRARWRLRAVALAMAVAASTLPSCAPEPAAGPPPAPANAAGSGLELIAPVNEASGPIVFRWKPGSAAVSYRLRFIDGREREIYTVELKDTQHTLPATVLDQMEDPVTYFWRVDALDAGGRVIESTRMVSFLWTR